MNTIKYDIKHYYQPTNFSCGQTATAILLSHYGKDFTPEQIVKAVPTLKNEAGEDWGTLSQQFAIWCLGQGFDVDFYTADFQLIDPSWASLSRDALLERMKAVKPECNAPSLGAEFSRLTLQTYIDFVEAGGALHIRQYMQTKLIDELLAKGPIRAGANYVVLHGVGRHRLGGLREIIADDVHGFAYNHAIVIYGRDKQGNYLVADSFTKPGHFVIEAEHLLCAMTAAQVECENTLFAITPRK